jgi:hypothetical protein
VRVVLGDPLLPRVTLSNAVAHFGAAWPLPQRPFMCTVNFHLAPLVLGIVVGARTCALLPHGMRARSLRSSAGVPSISEEVFRFA